MLNANTRALRARYSLRAAIADALFGATSDARTTRLLAVSLAGALTMSAAVGAAPQPPIPGAPQSARTAAAATSGMLASVDPALSSKVLPERAAQGIELRLQHGVFDPTQRSAPIPVDLTITAPRGDSDYHLVQFSGPIRPQSRAALTSAGAKIVDYVPDFAFIVKARASSIQTLAANSAVRWTGLYQPAYRLSGDLLAAIPQADPRRTIDLTVRLFAGESTAALRAFESDRNFAVLATNADAGGGAILQVRVAETLVRDLAFVPEVAWIEPTRERTLTNEIARSDDAMRKDFVEGALGLYGQNQVVVVGDTGFSTGNTATVHQDVRGRMLGGTTGTGSTCGGWADTHSHGSHVVGSVLGNGFHSGADVPNHDYTGSNAGVAPEATLYMWGFCTDFSGLPAGMYANYYGLMYGVDPRARINTNSWGYTTGQGNYNAETRETDRFIRDNPDMIVLYAAGNAGRDTDSNGVVNPNSTNMPATAKNVITVGASENFRLTGGLNPGGPCSTWGGCFSGYPTAPINGDLISNNLNGMAAFSSRGPVNDGRLKPDVVAPGTNIVSTRHSGTGQPWGIFDANYLYYGGTSMATPLVAGAAAIVREYYQVEHIVANPGAALVKATLMNGAFDMSPGQYGAGVTQDVLRRPDINQGWGRVDLRNSLVYEGGRNLYFHEATVGLNTGQSFQTVVNVVDGAVPLRASLVWIDAAGTEASFGALVNDLDLTLQSPGGTIFNGNDMVDGVIDLDVDRVNNVEGIDVTAPQTGAWTATVSGFNVPTGPQRFALVITGGLPTPPFSVEADPSAIQMCAGPDATIDLDVTQDEPTFTDPVTLSVSGNPAGTTTSLSVNNQAPPFTSVLTIGDTDLAAGGSSSILITGTAGADVDSTIVNLQLVADEPGTFDLTAPVDDATDVLLLPTLTWDASTEASSYLVEVATDAGFTNIVHSSTVSSPSLTLPTALNSLTEYFWRVRASNLCGDESSAESSFTTREAPRILLVDDDNNAPDVRPLYAAAVTAVAGAGSFDVVDTLTQGEPSAAALSAYDQVVWFSGDQFGSGSATNPLAGPTAASETALATWLDGGACLLLSSQDYYYDRDEVVSPFMTNYLGVGTITNDPTTNRYTSVAGENAYLGVGGALTFPSGFANWLDFMTVNAQPGVARAFLGSAAAVTNGAGVSKLTAGYLTTFMPYPIENLAPANTQAVVQRFFNVCPVGGGNTAPTFTAEPYAFAVDEESVASTVVGSVSATDPDVGQTLVYSITGGNTGGAFAINGASGQITVATPNAVQPGTPFSLTVLVNDQSGGNDTTTVAITVNNVNDAPVADNDSYAATEDTVLNVPLAGVLIGDTDADGNPLTASLLTQPLNGDVVLASDGSFSYTPDENFCSAVAETFTYVANDTTVDSAPATVSITVACVNDVPEFTAAPYSFNVDEAAANGTAVGTVTATDPESGVSYAIDSGNTDGAFAINPTTGQITVANATAVALANDPFTLTVQATDAASQSGSAQVTIDVNDINLAPVAGSFADAVAVETIAFSLDASDAFTDPDNDTLAYAASGLPASLSINPTTGVISGTPVAGDIGTHPITVTATDPGTLDDTVTFDLEVLAVRIFANGFQD